MKRQTDYGYEIKPVYTPKDIEGLDYAKDIADPAHIPSFAGIIQMGIVVVCGQGG